MATSWRSCELAGNDGAGEWIRYDADVTESIERGHQQLLLQQQEELTLQFDGFTIQLPELLHVDSSDGSHRHIARFVGEHLVLGSDEFLACDELECCQVSCFMDFGAEQEQRAAEALRDSFDAAVRGTAVPASLRCLREPEANPQRARQLLHLTDAAQLQGGAEQWLAELHGVGVSVLSAERRAHSPSLAAVFAAAFSDPAAAPRLVDGILALKIYSDEFPAEQPLFRTINTALRVTNGDAEPGMSVDDAVFLSFAVQPFVDAAEFMLREVLPKCRQVTFRGVGFELERPRIGATFPQLCFTSTSSEERQAQRFAQRTLMVLMTQSGASISFASMISGESEVLLPPGVELEVVARASATLLNVLHYGAGKKLVTLREVGMRPAPSELFEAARAVLPVYDRFDEIYEIPSVAPRGAVGGGAAVGGEAGGGAAAGNNNENNPNAVRLDAALDQNSNTSSSSRSDMLITADGGTGKTAAAVFAQVHLSRQDAGRRLLPVFLPLARLKQDDVTRQGGLDAALATALGCDVETLLQTAREFSVVAILDSLDETMVKDEHWAGLLERNPAAQQCRVIMTSRPTPLATQQHQRIFGRTRRVQVLDLLPLPPRSVNEIYQQLLGCALVGWHAELVLPAPIAAFATPLLASFAATLTLLQARPLEEERLQRDGRRDVRLSDITILDGITGQRELIELYLQHTCDLPQAALSKLCLNLLARGFHCALGEAKAAAEAADVASRVPCRVEDEFDNGADFSLLHRSLVEHVVAREVAAERSSFGGEGGVGKLSPVVLTGVTRMVLADAQCPFKVRLQVVQHLIINDQDPSALNLAQELLAEEERRADGQPTNEFAALLEAIASGHSHRGDVQRAQECSERALGMYEALYEQEQRAHQKQQRGLNVAIGCHNLAGIYKRQQNYSAAQQHYERAIELKERHGGDEAEIAGTRQNLAGLFSAQGDHTRALQELERCLAIFERHLGRGHRNVATCLSNMGYDYVHLRQFDRAVLVLREALAIQSRELPPDHISNASSHATLGGALRCLGFKQEARRHYAEAVRISVLYGQADKVQRYRRALAQIGN